MSKYTVQTDINLYVYVFIYFAIVIIEFKLFDFCLFAVNFVVKKTIKLV